MEPAASAAPGAATGSPAAAAAAAAQPAAAVTQQAPQLPAAANKQLQRLALLTRKNLCELFVTKGQAADLLHLEVKLRELRAKQGAEHVSPLVGAIVRAKSGGQYRLHRITAVEEAVHPGGTEWCLHVEPPTPLGTYVLPAHLSATNSLLEKGPYENEGGSQERASFEAWMGYPGWDLAATAAAAWRLKVAKQWAPNLGPWLAQHGPAKLLFGLQAPPGIDEMARFLDAFDLPVAAASPAQEQQAGQQRSLDSTLAQQEKAAAAAVARAPAVPTAAAPAAASRDPRLIPAASNQAGAGAAAAAGQQQEQQAAAKPAMPLPPQEDQQQQAAAEQASKPQPAGQVGMEQQSRAVAQQPAAQRPMEQQQQQPAAEQTATRQPAAQRRIEEQRRKATQLPVAERPAIDWPTAERPPEQSRPTEQQPVAQRPTEKERRSTEQEQQQQQQASTQQPAAQQPTEEQRRSPTERAAAQGPTEEQRRPATERPTVQQPAKQEQIVEEALESGTLPTEALCVLVRALQAAHDAGEWPVMGLCSLSTRMKRRDGTQWTAPAALGMKLRDFCRAATELPVFRTAGIKVVWQKEQHESNAWAMMAVGQQSAASRLKLLQLAAQHWERRQEEEKHSQRKHLLDSQPNSPRQPKRQAVETHVDKGGAAQPAAPAWAAALPAQPLLAYQPSAATYCLAPPPFTYPALPPYPTYPYGYQPAAVGVAEEGDDWRESADSSTHSEPRSSGYGHIPTWVRDLWEEACLRLSSSQGLPIELGRLGNKMRDLICRSVTAEDMGGLSLKELCMRMEREGLCSVGYGGRSGTSLEIQMLYF